MKLFILLGMIGWWQIVVILIVVLLLFGGKKIPELMKGVGKGIKEFKDGVNPEKEEDEEDEKKKDKNNSK